MAKFWRSSQFESLNQEWEKKLKESGFQDVEKKVGREKVLKQSSDYAYRRREATEIVRDAKLTYFTLLSQWISAEKEFFDPQLTLTFNPQFEIQNADRLIMERTAEGKTIREISRELKSLGMHKFNRDTIRYIRRRYENKWGIKNWKPEQMVSRRPPIRSSPFQAALFQSNTAI